jgi:hypothetical protein
MPAYDYHCPTNGRTLEVKHRMLEELRTWGELCAKAELPLGDTPPEAPVERLVSETAVRMGAGGSAASYSAPAPSCGAGGCGAGHCGFN